MNVRSIEDFDSMEIGLSVSCQDKIVVLGGDWRGISAWMLVTILIY